jgi:hypothetical protein
MADKASIIAKSSVYVSLHKHKRGVKWLVTGVIREKPKRCNTVKVKYGVKLEIRVRRKVYKVPRGKKKYTQFSVFSEVL